MKYASIDLETTGLNWDKNQIIEIGIVLDDWDNVRPIDQLPTFHCYVTHEEVSGNPFAMALNKEILEKIGRFQQERDEKLITGDIDYPAAKVYNLERYIKPQDVSRTLVTFFKRNAFDPKHM